MPETNTFLELLNLSNPLTRYILGLAGLFISLFVLKYLSKLLQWATEKILIKKDFLAKSWINIMGRNKLFSNIFFAFCIVFLSSIVPLFLPDIYPKTSKVVTRLINSFVLISFMLVINSFLSVLSDKYSRSIKLPVKGIVQAIKVVCWIVTIILIMSVMINKQPIYLLGGLTALSAVILLIFKDSILGLTSGFQLLLNDLVRVGDWIEIPSQGADGEVVDILLTTVCVQNWDNTIVNIPAYDLISHSFTNWRGMTESGGRRIKRAINIDVRTVKFLEAEDIARFKQIDILKEYLERKEREIAAINHKDGKDVNIYNARRLSNVGTFRAYCFEYLKNNPHISKKFTCMVRQLAPTSEGLPLEVYAFSNDINWVNYEVIQADIFDHILSIIPVFGLKVFQRFSSD